MKVQNVISINSELSDYRNTHSLYCPKLHAHLSATVVPRHSMKELGSLGFFNGTKVETHHVNIVTSNGNQLQSR